MKKVRLAIVGSTEFARDAAAAEVAAKHIIDAVTHPSVVVVISGGAEGIDTMAAEAARRFGIEVIEHLPKNKRWRPDGYEDRNRLIAKDCTHLLCIRHADSKTYGSGWTADYAEWLGRKVKRITIEHG